MPDKEATTVANELWKIIGIFGPPKVIHSDNGPEFYAEVVRTLVENPAIGSNQRFTTAYNPHQSGKVESHVKSVTQALHKMIDASYTPSWSSLLPMVQLFLNSKVRQSTNTSPFALMFNRVHNAFEYYTSLDMENLSKLSYTDWLARQQHLHTVIFPVVASRMLALHAHVQQKYRTI